MAIQKRHNPFNTLMHYSYTNTMLGTDTTSMHYHQTRWHPGSDPGSRLAQRSVPDTPTERQRKLSAHTAHQNMNFVVTRYTAVVYKRQDRATANRRASQPHATRILSTESEWRAASSEHRLRLGRRSRARCGIQIVMLIARTIISHFTKWKSNVSTHTQILTSIYAHVVNKITYLIH